MKLLLASSSPYRRAQLQQLNIEFDCASPQIDETAKPGESAPDLVKRLSREKAQALAGQYPEHLIIGSDQVASSGQRILTKPGNFSNAAAQLSQCNGRTITFYTGLCLFHSPSGKFDLSMATTEVTFRTLTPKQITSYLKTEEPYDCAGSFKCEGLGISLFEKITSDDPTALVGLPLIRLTAILARAGLDPLGD